MPSGIDAAFPSSLAPVLDGVSVGLVGDGVEVGVEVGVDVDDDAVSLKDSYISQLRFHAPSYLNPPDQNQELTVGYSS